ncbi:MAG: cytidine deaminase [Clostridia bacterium]|nr:cytidine deaminase [Clostridia bacterium]
MKNEELIALAKNARQNSKSIYSKFKVGVALLTKSGNVYTGINIEDPQFLILGICAERLAIYKAIESNEKEFLKIAIVGGVDKLVKTTPCGICRQLMLMFCPNIEIIYLDNNQNICVKTIKELLPEEYEEKF